MLKKIFYIIKRIVFSSFLLYGYNIIVEPINLTMPINFITIGCISIFGVPALLSLIIINIIIF